MQRFYRDYNRRGAASQPTQRRHAARSGGEDRRLRGNGHGQTGPRAARPAGGEPVQGDPVRESEVKQRRPMKQEQKLNKRMLIWDSCASSALVFNKLYTKKQHGQFVS